MVKRILAALFINLILFSASFNIYAAGDSFDSVNYQLVDYVTPNGNDVAILLDYIPNGNTIIDADFYSSYLSSRYFYGALGTSKPQYGVSMVDTKRYRVRYLNGNIYSSSDSNTYFENKLFHIHQQNGSTTISSSGESDVVLTYNTNNYTATYSLAIFAAYNGSNLSGYANNARLYDFKIYENSVLLHHYYPCYRKSDNVVGIFDGVTNTFYAGTGGNLSYGSAVSNNYTITTSVSPSGSGTVSGGGSYASGSNIQLSATAYSGYVFDHWSDNNTSNPRSITVTDNETYTAYFVEESVPTPSYTVSLSVSPVGSGTVTGSGSYVSGTSVNISAVPTSGYSFVKWSDDVTDSSRTIIVSDDISLIAYFEAESVNPDPDIPNPPSGWIDWTDTDDSEYLDPINDIDMSKIYWSVNFERINDFVQIYQTQYNVNKSSTNNSVVSIYGTYYDNTITSLTSCNSTSYNVSSESHTIDTMVYVQPAVYGSLDTNLGQPGEDIIMNFAMDIESGLSGNETYTTSNIENRTEACRLVGMNTGDGSIDGGILLANGYEKKTLTYNDGSNHPPTATFYVPGNEVIDMDLDLSFLNDLMDSLYIQVVNQTKVIAHDEFIIRFHGKDGYLFPEYGHVHADTFLGVLLSGLDFNAVHPFIGRIEDRYYLIPQDNTYASFNDSFSYHISNNMYDKNYIDLYWQETRNPEWRFKTNSFDHSLLNGAFRPSYKFNNDYGGRIYSFAESYTITSEDLSIDSNLTAGTLLKVGLASVNMYNFKSNSILNRFNQLGSFLQSWFTRIYNSIGNITGGNESNEIINNVITDYDINVETNFNGLLTNVENKKQEIDLTLPQYNIPSDDVSGIQGLAGAFKDMYSEVYINNGLGLVILIPVLLLILRLIL